MLELCGCGEMLAIADSTDIAWVRRRAVSLAFEIGFDEQQSGEVALVASELASNVWKHARGGGMLLGVETRGDSRGVALCAWDRGPGMNLERCLVDGVSGAGTSGTGLGSVARLASAWDGFSSSGSGTVISSVCYPRKPAPEGRFRCGALSLPHPTETVCGDAYRCVLSHGVATVLVVDGLGHGTLAAEAARSVCESFEAYPDEAPGRILQRAHTAARHTRGAAAAIARIDPSAGELVFCGVGNIAGFIWADTGLRSLLSHHGTLGHALTRTHEERYPLAAGATVILSSDGLKSRFDLEAYAGLARSAPSTIATLLWRDFNRGRDDATVAVVRAIGASS